MDAGFLKHQCYRRAVVWRKKPKCGLTRCNECGNSKCNMNRKQRSASTSIENLISMSKTEGLQIILQWGEAVTNPQVSPPDIAAFFSTDATLRGTVSGILRKRNKGIDNQWVTASNGKAEQNTIEAYFKYFNATNLQGLTTVWDDSNDDAQQLSSNTWLYTLFRKFEYKQNDQSWTSVRAVMTFIVQKRSGSIKPLIIALISAPLFTPVLEKLNEKEILN